MIQNGPTVSSRKGELVMVRIGKEMEKQVHPEQELIH